MKEKWKGLSKTEKILIVSVIVLAIAVIINWKRIYKEASRGFGKYRKETPKADTLTFDNKKTDYYV